MESAIKLFFVLGITSLTKVCGMYITSRPVEETPKLFTLLDLVKQDIDYRYTDAYKRLTAIKDKDLRSCFVTDYDPQWILYKSEKESISRRKTYDVVNTDPDFDKLKDKAGHVIATMCRKVKIFWMNERPPIPPPQSGGLLPPPLPINPGSPQTLNQMPPLLPVPAGSTHQEGTSVDLAPPPLLPGTSSGSLDEHMFPMEVPMNQHKVDPPMNAPPMLHQQNAIPDENIETPPPLNEWLQQQSETKNTQAPPLLPRVETESEMKAPPRLANPVHSERNGAPPKIGGDTNDLIEPPKRPPALGHSDHFDVIQEVTPPKVKSEIIDLLRPLKIPGPIEPQKLPEQKMPLEFDLHEPPRGVLDSLHEPETGNRRRDIDMLEPVPDFRTPPRPFKK